MNAAIIIILISVVVWLCWEIARRDRVIEQNLAEIRELVQLLGLADEAIRACKSLREMHREASALRATLNSAANDLSKGDRSEQRKQEAQAFFSRPRTAADRIDIESKEGER